MLAAIGTAEASPAAGESRETETAHSRWVPVNRRGRRDRSSITLLLSAKEEGEVDGGSKKLLLFSRIGGSDNPRRRLNRKGVRAIWGSESHVIRELRSESRVRVRRISGGRNRLLAGVGGELVVFTRFNKIAA